MKPLRLTVNKLAIDLQVPATGIGEIVHQRRRYFKTYPEFWLKLQTFCELELTRRSGVVSDIERHVHPAAELVF